MNKAFFLRSARMTHKYGETEKINDPGGMNTFEPPRRLMPGDLCGPSYEVQQYGEHKVWNPSRSPVQKPNGSFASINGPSPDWAEGAVAPVPVSTKKRKSP